MKFNLAVSKTGLWLANGFLFVCLAASPSISSGASLSASAADHSAAPPALSPGVADVLKMADAKVDPDTIKAFIRSSPVPYNPSASEIIALKERGLSSDILTAMLERGGELRAM